MQNPSLNFPPHTPKNAVSSHTYTYCTYRTLLQWFAVVTMAVWSMGASCKGRPVEEQPDSGTPPVILSCEDVSDCPEGSSYECVGGLCLQRCAADAACNLDSFCSSRGYCEVGCRDSSSCSADQLCSAGQCVDKASVGSCASKCDCAPGEVCKDNLCQPPPDGCTTPADCGRGPADRCEAYQCNGFTRQCFDPDPQPCAAPADCVGRPGCESGCFCTGAGQCVPDVQCTIADEANTCGADFYCDDNGACAVLPACTTNAECTPLDLICNTGRNRCERPRSCASAADCTVQPAVFCDVTTSFCAVPTCNNGGRTCGAEEDCSVDGRCVPAGTGQACASDVECPNDPWPTTQYCSFAFGAQGQCAIGCRGNGSCSGDDICNGARQCVSSGGGSGDGQFGSACVDDSSCSAGLVCGLLTSTCAEPCDVAGSPCAGGLCCPLSGAARCNTFGFCAN